MNNLIFKRYHIEKFKFKDGIYEGEATNNIPNDKDWWTFEKDYGYYEGDFASGVFHGKGKLIRCDGMIIDGIWKNGEFVNIETPYRWEQ